MNREVQGDACMTPEVLTRAPRVLMVDDDPGNLVALSAVLADLGSELVCVSSGREALRQVLKTDFAVILLDVRMPEMDGYETAGLIRSRSRSRRTPLIFLTAYDKDEANVFRGYSSGAVDYVFKPVEPVILRAKVATFIEMYRQADEIRRKAELERRLWEENFRIRTENLKTEEALRSSEVRQSLMIQTLPVKFYEADLKEHTKFRKFVAGGSGKLSGLRSLDNADDAIPWAERVHPEDWPEVASILDAVTDASKYSMEYRWKCADGTYRYFLDEGVLVPGEEGEAPKIFGMILDLHDRRVLEHELVHVRKLDAIGKLTGGIVHDFSNMLTIVIGNLDRARKAGQLDAIADAHVDLALRASLHCRGMTKRLISFARQQNLAPTPFEANQMLDGLVELLEVTLEEKYVIEKDLGVIDLPVFADPVQVEAAIVNLVLNARDAMDRGGRIRIATSRLSVGKGRAHSGSLMPGEYVQIDVADHGVGMSKEVLARALEPFFTTKEDGRGTGLGLSTVYGFVRQSGGDLVVFSEPGKGALVRMILPCQKAGRRSQWAPVVMGVNSDLRARDGEVVLVVDDDEGVRRTAADMLNDLGYRVLEAAGSTDVFGHLQREKAVSLLFTDLFMPDQMNGYELAMEVQRRRPAIRVLFTSAHIGDRIHEIADGWPEPFLRKPFRDLELARAVRSALS